MLFYPFSMMGAVFSVAIFWTIAWKGVALWKAARNNDPVWFVVLLFVNTIGILEIAYIYLFSHPHAPAFSMYPVKDRVSNGVHESSAEDLPKKPRGASRKKSNI